MYNAVDGDVDLVKVDQQVRLIESYHHHVMIWSASRLVACKPRPTSKLGHCQVTARFLRSITPRDKYRSPPPLPRAFYFDICCSCQPSSQLRSSDIATFVVPRTYTRLGDHAFPVAGPRLWNSLPSNLRQSDLTLQQFRRALKDVSVWFTKTPAPSDFCF